MDTIRGKLQESNLVLSDEAIELLTQLEERGHLFLGWPDSERPANWFSWFPEDIPRQRSTAIVSSRLGRKLDEFDSLFRVVRAALTQLNPLAQNVLTVDGTTMQSVLKRGCELFGIPRLSVQVARREQTIDAWASHVLAQGAKHKTACYLSPEMNQVAKLPPLRDRVEVLESDQLVALHVRPNGNLHRLLIHRLREQSNSRTFVALGDGQLVPNELANELMEAGAIGWYLWNQQRDEQESTLRLGESQRPKAPILDKFDDQDAYLVHCTRRADGAWPDQDEEAYLDELILGDVARDRSSFAAISRIVGMQKLLATCTSVRGVQPVVSFTAVPLGAISTLRVFRAHRGRWDFEPYGVAIHRDVLRPLGARPVTYGNEETWKSLSPDDRAYFQKVGDEDNSIDWRVEKEWRVEGDVNLSELNASQVRVFVPTLAEAERIAEFSRWPVITTKS